jgi:hypothetical protein
VRVVKQASSFDLTDGQRDGLVVWVPAIVGVGLLAGLLLAVLAWTPVAHTSSPTAGRPTARESMPTAGPLIPPSPAAPARLPSAGGRATVAPPRHIRPAPPPASRSAASNAPRTALPADVTGRYRVVDSYRTGFIGEVVITNASGGPRPWSVRLVFGSSVGVMRTFWVESQPQATLRRSGPAYIFTGSVPLAARSSVVLRFQFDWSGSDRKPMSCLTNGLTCAGL